MAHTESLSRRTLVSRLVALSNGAAHQALVPGRAARGASEAATRVLYITCEIVQSRPVALPTRGRLVAQPAQRKPGAGTPARLYLTAGAAVPCLASRALVMRVT